MSDFISDVEMGNLEKAGKAKGPSHFKPADFISDDQMVHLEKSGKAPIGNEKQGAGQAALEAFGDSATFGYLPHLQSLAAKITPDPNSGLDAKLKAEGFKIHNAPEKGYIQNRDENLARQSQQKKDFPLATTAGSVGGTLAVGLMIPGGAWLNKGKIAVRAAKGAGLSAGLGLIQNPGDVEGNVSVMPVERLKNAAMGGVLGAALPAGMTLLGAGAQKGAALLKTKAEEKAFRSLGRGTPTGMQKMVRSGQNIEIGRELLDQGAIPILGTPGSIASRVEKLKEAAGERVGRLIDDAQAAGRAEKVEYTPIKISNPKRMVEVQPEIRMTPIRIDENPLKRIMPWLSDRDAPARVVRGEEQPIQKALYGKATPKVTAGKVQEILTDRNSIDAKKLALEIFNSPELILMRKTPGMESAVSSIERQIITLAENRRMDLKQAHALRKEIDKSINWNKSSPDIGAAEGLRMQRTKIRDAMNENINTLNPGDQKDQLIHANRKYGQMATADDILQRELARNQSNRAISLTDTIAAGAGAATGSGGAALILGALNKAGRTFGNSIQARGYDAIAANLTKSAPVMAMAQSNPGVVSRLASGLGQEVTGGKQDYSVEKDPILNDREILMLFKKDEGLLESVQDPRRRALIKQAIGRLPVGK